MTGASARFRAGGRPQRAPSPERGGYEIEVAGEELVADSAGALYWPGERLLVVADLHLEKGTSLALRGMLLPPYDTAATLGQVGALVARYAPRRVVALGDSFHDGDGPRRVSPADRATLVALQRGREWIWIAGNHDPEPVKGLGGVSARTLAIGALVFRHEPQPGTADGEIAGHLHPLARVNGRGRVLSRRCFASNGRRLVMPALGAYAGGLNVRDEAFAEIFGTLQFTAHVLGGTRLYAIAAQRCRRD